MIALLCGYHSVNCHVVVCLPIMYIFCRDTSSELWTPVLFSYIAYNRFHSFSSSFARWSYFIIIIFYIHTFKFFVFGKPERLTAALFCWGKVVCL